MHPLEAYLRDLSQIRSTGAAVRETSYYVPLANLLNTVGHTLRPRVRCVINLRNRGAGIPDGGLFSPDQFQKASSAEPLAGQLPSRGVIEVKGTGDDAWVTAQGEQVSRYWGRYRQVLVTNYRDFVLVGASPDGTPAKLETFRLAESERAFWSAAAHPRKVAEELGERFEEYLKRVMLNAASLALPRDVAWFLASYARDARSRIERSDLPELSALRLVLADSLGLTFEGEKGEHFFRSTPVQTLFYGVFAAWVLWSKRHPPGDKTARFNWHEASWSLHVPMIKALYEQIATPSNLGPLGLVEVLDWTAAALNRVDRASFFRSFQEEQPVQYFYEPFLEAFDPELRKELGVWYTPHEIVRYMVARVDSALRNELGLADGLADPNVYVLDPCCGTGAYLVEVLRRIHETLGARGADALHADDLKRAAMERVFGFEILPAPFVVAHLQLGLLLQQLGAPLAGSQATNRVYEGNHKRVGVYLTNSLTGWEPPKDPKQHLIFPEMEAERDAAERVKQRTPILVILGNPPYNGFAGVAVDEEHDLTAAYRETRRAPAPQGQGLNDLYVRFYRMAERRITGMTGKGVVCFISNYSWLDGLSFTGMRERYLEAFDRIRIDNLNGDKYRTGKLTPEGKPDPSVFSTERNREGIQVGTAIALLVRRAEHAPTETVEFRNWWGKEKRAELATAADGGTAPAYEEVRPAAELGYPFSPAAVSAEYMKWPLLTELFPVSFPGVKTSRDDVLVDIDRDQLIRRMELYFDPAVSNEEIARVAPEIMQSTRRFQSEITRAQLQKRGFLRDHIVRYLYRPFDTRWVYWEPETKLLDEKRTGFFSQIFKGNVWIATQQKPRKLWSKPQVVRPLACIDLMDRSASFLPLLLQNLDAGDLFQSPRGTGPTSEGGSHVNLSPVAMRYPKAIGHEGGLEAVFYHVIAILHSVRFADENRGALRQDWPRIPFPSHGTVLCASAKLGEQIATLFDTDKEIPGVTTGKLRPELRDLAVISRVGGGDLDPVAGELAVTARWGITGRGGVTMPSTGKVVERDFTTDEYSALERGAESLGLTRSGVCELLGATTYDVYLNDVAYWRNIPAGVWHYMLGGYQVIKKWLSYREQSILGRDMTPDEVREVTGMARRIAALILHGPALDANYEAVTRSTYVWPVSSPSAGPLGRH
jgi:hypothetical protein